MATVGSFDVLRMGVYLNKGVELGDSLSDREYVFVLGVEQSITLHNVLATELLLRLLHDLQELLEADTAITRDIGLVDNLVNIGL